MECVVARPKQSFNKARDANKGFLLTGLSHENACPTSEIGTRAETSDLRIMLNRPFTVIGQSYAE